MLKYFYNGVLKLEVPCLFNQFSCPNGNCVPMFKVNDGVDDCGDRSDETNLGNLTI